MVFLFARLSPCLPVRLSLPHSVMSIHCGVKEQGELCQNSGAYHGVSDKMLKAVFLIRAHLSGKQTSVQCLPAFHHHSPHRNK